MIDSSDEKQRTVLRETLETLWTIEQDFRRSLGDFSAVRAKAPDVSSVVDSILPDTTKQRQNELDGTSLAQLEKLVTACRLCKLEKTRHLVVFGEGNIPARVMVVGEGPGADEDATGRPFVGKAGQYLDRWLASIQLSRTNGAYIANIVKCRPPGNRDPESDEIAHCLPYLERQIELIRPETILCLGRVSAHTLLNREGTLQSMRGQWFRYRSVPLLVTYHPSAVLRNPSLRAPVWEDMQRLAAFLHIELPKKAR